MVTLSVYLDGSFWVGVLEIVEDGTTLRAARAAARVSTRGTAAQEAMRLELESRKAEATADRRARRRELDEHRREAARRKRLERRRGR